MAKRYGRNQKRKHRERIAELEGAYHRELGLIVQVSDERDRYKSVYRELVSEIKRWWDNSVLLDPKVEDVSEFPPYFRMASDKPLSAHQVAQFPSSELEVHYQTLEACEIAAMKDYGNRVMHIRLRTSNKHVGYYINPDAFGIFNGIPQKALPELFEQLVCEFNREYKKGV